MVASHIVGVVLVLGESAGGTNCLSACEASLVDSAILSTGLSNHSLQCILPIRVPKKTIVFQKKLNKINDLWLNFVQMAESVLDWLL